MNKNSSFHNLSLYKSLIIFVKQNMHIIYNLQKDAKITIGYKIIEIIVQVFFELRNAYNFNVKEEKIAHINKIINYFENLEDLFKILFELNFINVKNMSNFSIGISDLLLQAHSWKKYNEK